MMEKINATALSRKEASFSFGTWFAKSASLDKLIGRCDEQLEKCRRWVENLEALKRQCELEKLDEKKDELKTYLNLLTKEEREAFLNN